ncbi:HAUS augmin-like complex subunit 3 [Latimeria chalumnae]|uniref:HAUS augmin like complex subunit 3 n=1 Tax=Latimeria chalumnae TaxID=7897 RepID=H3AJM4_LATCH|nr:PREDICTED: HAUS augmin-like complex subunit 3 [Latimeria chalumnae]|eukprot:XP_006007055.1 PREDICTED: HAUS augmin-like complex subunit 3 [Latimeria chalumnae]
MNNGNKFVETLKKAGYPKVSKLNGSDFDWLFETVEDRSFLEWFCSSVNEQIVLSENEIKSFESLKKSGEPILEEKALDEVLQTYKATESKGDLEELELEKLEEELRTLQKIKNLKIYRRNKLQVMASASNHTSLKLSDEEKEANKVLKEAQEKLGAENAKLNSQLQTLIEGVKQLTSFFVISEEAERGSGHSPVFLSQLGLEKYLHQEEQSTAALTSYTKKQFFEGISELVESSNEENFQLLDTSSHSVHFENNDVWDQRQREMSRLQFAYICAQHQLIQLKAEVQSTKASLKWAQDNLHSICAKKEFGKEDDLQARITSLNKEISLIDQQVEQINTENLPTLVRENAVLLNMPIVKGDFDLQISRQDYYTSRQDQVCNQLIKQKASFELLHLAYEIELRKHRSIHRQLESLTKELEDSRTRLEQRLEVFSDPAISQTVKQRNTIDSRDTAMHRLYQMLEGASGKQQLFRTYDGLEEAAQKLQQDVALLQEQLAVCNQEQFCLLSKLESDSETFQDAMYSGHKQLLLSSQELSEPLQQLESQTKELNQIVMDIRGDVREKRKTLETNKMYQMERQLYLYFFEQEDRLKDTVEKLEEQVKAQAIDLQH